MKLRMKCHAKFWMREKNIETNGELPFLKSQVVQKG